MICSKCKIDKPLEEFHRNRCKPSGYNCYCKPCTNAYYRNSEIRKEYERKRRLNHMPKRQAVTQKCAVRTKLEGLRFYSNNNIPYCLCCNETNPYLLTLDHINNDGAKHRREDPGAKNIYYWAKRHNYPEGFQVLCMNCNWGKSNHGICPHKFETSALAVGQ